MNKINYQKLEYNPQFNIITAENEPTSDAAKDDILSPLLPKENPNNTIFWCVIKFNSTSLLNSTKRFGYYFLVCVKGKSNNQYAHATVKLTRPKDGIFCFHITKQDAIQISNFILKKDYTSVSDEVERNINNLLKILKSDIICLESLTKLINDIIHDKYEKQVIPFCSFEPIPIQSTPILNKGGKQLKCTQRKKRTHHKKHTRRHRKH